MGPFGRRIVVPPNRGTAGSTGRRVAGHGFSISAVATMRAVDDAVRRPLPFSRCSARSMALTTFVSYGSAHE